MMPHSTNHSLLDDAEQALHHATDYAWSIAKDDGHWYGELRANVTITAEQIFFHQILGQYKGPIPDAEEYNRYLLSEQREDGSWSIAPEYPGDVSTSSEAYLALKILGMSAKHPVMTAAAAFIRHNGGLEKARIFTRIYFAVFGLFPWDATPQLPAEFILLPSWAPMSPYILSSWSRSTIIPLLIIAHHRQIHALPNGRRKNNDFIDELWNNPSRKTVPIGPGLSALVITDPLAFVFTLADNVLHWLGGLRKTPLRSYARKKCIEWILDHQEKEGDWAGIIPPMHAGVQALLLEGFAIDSPEVRGGLEAIERFTWQDEIGKRLQSCVSPVWDTVLMLRGLCDAATVEPAYLRLKQASTWIKKRQILGNEGDWRIFRPKLAPGGFAFEYYNRWYPDVDDTAAAVLALMAQDKAATETTSVVQGIEWMLGMQNKDGGWAAFDYNNDKLWLNRIPFSDMNSLCDPSTPDVTGRILESLGIFIDNAQELGLPVYPVLAKKISSAVERSIDYLLQTQKGDGSWFGRWGANHIYGTSHVLCGLSYFLAREQVSISARRGSQWMRTLQNEDGGWGESLHSYKTFDHVEYRVRCTSTPSQTAWALMGMLTTIDPSDVAIRRGVEHLIREQTIEGVAGKSWHERLYTAVGFIDHFWICYDLYRHYFPMMALGRYVAKCKIRPEERRGVKGLS